MLALEVTPESPDSIPSQGRIIFSLRMFQVDELSLHRILIQKMSASVPYSNCIHGTCMRYKLVPTSTLFHLSLV